MAEYSYFHTPNMKVDPDEVLELATTAAIQLHKCYNWSQYSDYGSTRPMQDYEPRSIIGDTNIRLKKLAWERAEATGRDFESVYNEMHLEFVRNELKIMMQELPLDPRETAVKVVIATKEDEGETCGVCQFEFEVGEEVSKTTPCKHMFHGICLWTWLYDHNTCPLCRSVLFE